MEVYSWANPLIINGDVPWLCLVTPEGISSLGDLEEHDFLSCQIYEGIFIRSHVCVILTFHILTATVLFVDGLEVTTLRQALI